MPDYSIVGATGNPQEYDGSRSTKITYAGSGGVSLGSPLHRLAFAIKYKQTNFLLNNAVSAAGAKIIFNRDPRDRVQKVAPFLTVDSDPYPIVDPQLGAHRLDRRRLHHDRRTSPIRRAQLAVATSPPTRCRRPAGRPTSPTTQINYIRNSVKATVDAYTGKVTLYRWDDTDPVLNAWSKIFPGLVKPRSEMPAVDPRARPLPGGPVRGAALAARHVPRGRPGDLLQRRWTSGPSRRTRPNPGVEPAAVLRAGLAADESVDHRRSSS